MVVDAAAEVAEQAVVLGRVTGIHDVGLLIQRVDQAEHLVRRRLAVVIQADYDVAVYMAISRHQGGRLPEIAGHADAEDILILLFQTLDLPPGIVRRVIVDQDDLIPVAAIRKDRPPDTPRHISQCSCTAVAGNDKG